MVVNASAIASMATKTPTCWASATASITTSVSVTYLLGAITNATASLATTSVTFSPPEVYTARFITTLTAPITSGLRPITISVGATQPAFGAGTFSIAIYDAGTDSNPTNFEALEVIAAGASTDWVVNTEVGWSPLTHPAGSTVVATVLTPRSIQQPLVNHVSPLNSPDPHSIYLRKASYANTGDLVVGAGGNGQFATLTVGADGQSLVADSTRTGGMRWVATSIVTAMTHMGDLIVGGLLGTLNRLGIGSLGQMLSVVQNAPAVATPVSAPTLSAVGSGGSLTNGVVYAFAYAWQTANSPPDGGTTPRSPTSTLAATTSGVIRVQAPAAPASGLSLIVYGAVSGQTLRQQGILAPTTTGAPNAITVSAINIASATPSLTNTTGGLGPGWATAGSVSSVGLVMPSDFAVAGSPVTGSGTLVVTPATQAVNAVHAGPSSGPAAAPTFRFLTGSDMPNPFTLATEATATDFSAAGISGATAGARFGGGTASGAPASSGVWNVGDFIIDQSPGGIWICTAGGVTPTWVRPFAYVQSPSSTAITNGSTITPTGLSSVRVSPASAVTGIIIAAGTTGGQVVSVVNEAVAANTVTFAAAGTSNVADGISCVIPGLTHKRFVWDSGTVLWYEAGASGSGGMTNPMTTAGDLIVGGASGTPTRLAASSTTGQVLTSNGAGVSPTYQTPTGGSGGGTSGTGGSVVPIQTQTPSGTNTVTFSVPAGFRNLRLTGVVRSTNASASSTLRVQFNGDAGSNYIGQILAGAGSTASGLAVPAATSGQIAGITAATALANSGASFVADFPDHAGTTFFKTWLSRDMGVFGATSASLEVDVVHGYWTNTAAINTITIFTLTGNYVTGSTLTLWGEADTAPVLLTTNSNLIQETILTVAAASVSIPNIPQGYRDLRIVVIARGDTAATTTSLGLQFNGDAGSNYDYENQFGTSSATANASTAQANGKVADLTAASSLANVPTEIEISIPGYTNTSFHKTYFARSWEVTGAAISSQQSNDHRGRWASASAITSISLAPGAGNFVSGTVVRVYGEPASAAGPSVGTGTRLRIGSNQSLTSATPLAVPWDTEDADADNQHNVSAAALTGTVAKTAGSATLTGTTTVFLTELSVGQVISVPGTATEVAVVIAIASNTSLTVAAPFANTLSGQTATRVNSAIVFRQPGFFDIEVGAYLDAVSTGVVTLQVRLNGTTIIGQSDSAGINAVAAYDLVVKRQFLQWDYVEVLVTQSTGGALNLRTDERTHVAVSARPTLMVVSGSQTSTAQVLNTGDTIFTLNISEARVAPAAAVTGVILQAGTYGGQEVWVVNESGAVNTVTFAAAGTSNVADGTSAIVPGLQGFKFVWDTGTSRWYHTAGGSASGGTTVLAGATAGSIVPIQTQTPSGTNTVTFSVPAGFKNARITASVRSDTVATLTELRMQFNGDTGGNYNTENRFTSATTVSASQSSASGSTLNATSVFVAQVNAASSAANVPANIVIDFPNHASTTLAKQFLARISSTVAGNAITNTELEEHYGNWNSTSAITSITLTLSAGNFVSGSTITLWGEADTAPALLTSNSNLIQETILTATAASIAIPNIPQGYRDLRISIDGRGDTAATSVGIGVQVNGDTGANYDWGAFAATNGAFVGFAPGGQAQAATQMYLIQVPAASAPAGASSTGEIIARDYTNTTFQKAFEGHGVVKLSTASAGQIFAGTGGFWRSTSAVTSLTIVIAAGNLIAGSVIRVYGEPAAAAGASVGTGTRARTGGQVIPSGTTTPLAWNSNDTDAALQHILSPTPATLTGTVALTAGSPTVTGTGTSFTTQVAVGQVLRIGTAVYASAALRASASMLSITTAPNTTTGFEDVVLGSSASMNAQGGVPQSGVVISVASATSLSLSTAAVASVSSQTAATTNTALVFQQPGMYSINLGCLLAAMPPGQVTLQFRLNGTTLIAQSDESSFALPSAYGLTEQRQFQQWDYVEALILQTSGLPVALLADERTHFESASRPTVIVAIPYIKLEDRKAAGTDGGTFASGADRTRDLNTVVSDSAGIVTLSANQFTLPPGTYRISALAPAFAVDHNRAWLYNVTDAVEQIGGSNNYAHSGATISFSFAPLSGRFTITGTKTFEIRHRCTTTGTTNGFGFQANTNFAVPFERFTEVEIWKEG